MSSKPSKRFGLSFSLGMTLWYALFLLAVALMLFAATRYLLRVDIHEKEHEVIDARVKEYVAWYEEGGIDSLRRCVNEQRQNSRDPFFVRVAEKDNQSLFYSIPAGFEGQHPSRVEQDLHPHPGPWLSVLGEDDKTFWTLSSTVLPDGRILQVGISDMEGRELLQALQASFTLVILPLLLLGIIGGGVLTFQAMHPVRQITATVRDILREGPGNRRVSARKGRGELNELATLFNQMLDNHQSLIRAMRESIDNVAHDLRTPLTRLRSAAEYALEKSSSVEDCRRALEDCAEEAERVTTMLNVLMDVAEAEAGSLKIHLSSFALCEAVGNVLDMYGPVSEEREILLASRVDPRLMVQADRTRLMQVLANLVDNALKYSGPLTTVTVAARTDKGFAVLTVADQGMGIAPDELPRIWDRLYRGDRSRSRQGLGLGLSLVKAVVHAHGGVVEVSSEVNHGSVFTVRLPLRTQNRRPLPWPPVVHGTGNRAVT